MADTRIPHGFLTHPQALIAGEDATNLHLRALVWSGEHRTDGAIPAVALGVLTSRRDAGELALRLVAAGLWSVTATGWQMVRERLSVIRAEAGRRGGLRSGEVRAAKPTKQVPKPPASGSPGVPDTTYARASDSELRSGEFQTQSTTPIPSAPKVVAVAPIANPEGAQRLAALADAGGGHFALDGGRPEDADDLAARLALLDSARDPAVIVAMGALCSTPKKAWPWATHFGDGPVTPAWLLGGKAANGTRTGRPLAELARRAVCIVRAQREAEAARQKAAQERAERLAAAEAEANRTPEEKAAVLRQIREEKAARDAAGAAFRAGLRAQAQGAAA